MMPLLSLFLTFLSLSHSELPITLEVNNIRSNQGMIWVGIYDSPANFLIKEKAIVKGYHIQEPGLMRITLPDLPNGTYALAVFHDVNNNGVMDQNILGVPTEPYAFSGQIKSRWRLPRFREVTHTFSRTNRSLSLTLKKWSAF